MSWKYEYANTDNEVIFKGLDIEEIREFIEEKITDITNQYSKYIKEISITWKEEGEVSK